MPPLTKLAMWGLGRHAVQRLLPAVANTPGIELRGVCSRSGDVVRQCAERWRCIGWTDPSAMLNDSGVDVIYVASPIALHAEYGRSVLESGKHLWCEKPLTSDLDSTLELVAKSQARRLAICEGHMYLYHPQFRHLRELVTSGRLGAIISVACRFGIPSLEHPGFRSDPALGGGALFDVGCYPVSAVHALFPGETHDLGYARVSYRGESGVDTDGWAVTALSNGVVAHLEWHRDVGYRNELEVWGERGSVVTDKIFSKPPDYRPVLRLRDAHGIESTEYAEACDHFVAMLSAFGEMIYDGTTAEIERQRIARDAQMLNQIWSRGRERPYKPITRGGFSSAIGNHD